MQKKKKQVKKTKRVAPKKTEIVVRVQSDQSVVPTAKDLEPEKSGGKYMIPKTWMTSQQVVQMVQKTPPQYIYTRPAKGGGTWSYVTQSYVVKVLNFVFGWNWNFKVINEEVLHGQIVVYGELTVMSPKGDSITKGQYGRADIKFRKGTQQALDYGNDKKAAASDSLKKSASLFGIASDIYGKMEFKQDAKKEIQDEAQPKLQTIQESDPVAQSLKPGQTRGPDGKPVYKCSSCEEIISEAEYQFSKRTHKKALCRECQKR